MDITHAASIVIANKSPKIRRTIDLGIQRQPRCETKKMPGLSGFGALEVLRQDPATAHIPVMALSANAIARDIARGMEAGLFSYLTKPIMVREFMAALDIALRYAAENRQT